MYYKTITDPFILIARKISLLSLMLIATTTHAPAHDSEIRDFIITKEPYSRLMVSPLPTKNGEFDFGRMIIGASLARWENLNLTPEMEEYLVMEISALQDEEYPAAEEHWESFIDSLKHYQTPVDLNAVQEVVLRESYLETTTDLLYFASKVKAINDMKKTLRDELDEATGIQTDSCSPPGTSGADICGDINDLITEFNILESQLEDMNIISNLQFLDLQQVLQSETQAYTLFSNMMKRNHEIAKTIISNLK